MFSASASEKSFRRSGAVTIFLNIATIVEGDGEVVAVPILLRRLIPHLCADAFAEILRPIRQPRDRLVYNKDECLKNSILLAAAKLKQLKFRDSASLILVLCDADEDCVKTLAEQMGAVASEAASQHSVSTILAVREYETWFVGAAESLERFLQLTGDIPENPEQSGSKKRWIEDRFKGTKYSETVDQARMTATMDLTRCRLRCPSFDKLCRDLERLLSLSKEVA